MKLYGSIKSERAEKGQGGNEFLEIEITNDKRQLLATVRMEPGSEKNKLTLSFNDELCLLEQRIAKKCECIDPLCAKCLLVNCTDLNCKVHPESKRKEFREMYKK